MSATELPSSRSNYPRVTQKARTTSDLWQASLTVGEISCSSCVGSITRALEEHKWIKKVDVNLISNSATVVFDGKTHLEEIEDIIKDVDYEAKFDDVVDLCQKRSYDIPRQVAIRLGGMYCEHCLPRVKAALANLDEVTLEKLPTIDYPIL
jgi:P-type Cu+ transporter